MLNDRAVLDILTDKMSAHITALHSVMSSVAEIHIELRMINAKLDLLMTEKEQHELQVKVWEAHMIKDAGCTPNRGHAQ